MARYPLPKEPPKGSPIDRTDREVLGGAGEGTRYSDRVHEPDPGPERGQDRDRFVLEAPDREREGAGRRKIGPLEIVDRERQGSLSGQ
jgi:hypothetical protein